MTGSRIPGFYRLDLPERHEALQARFGLSDKDLAVLVDGASPRLRARRQDG